MAGSKQFLFLPEGEASACLEVLRRICQPQSRSLPHITLRYSKKPLKKNAHELYVDLAVNDLVIDQATSFDHEEVGHGINTLVLLCDSEQLERVSYRPAFPQSIFHITLYDGEESSLAARVLEALRTLEWGLKLQIELIRYSSSAEAANDSTLAFRGDGWFTDLGHSIYSEEIAFLGLKSSLANHTDDERIRLARAVAERLHVASKVSAAERTKARSHLRLEGFSELGQLAFWTEDDVSSMSPGVKGVSREGIARHSTYITPPELASDVVDAISDVLGPDELVDFGDPAIGAGIFFAALRHRIGDDRINSARGVEIDVGSAKRTLHRWRNTKLSVLVGDFIEEKPEERTWTLVIANPPYRRSQLLGDAQSPVRQRLERETGLEISARSDLYLYFILRAHSWMRRGCLAAWVIPAEFQVTDYARSLREYLATRVQLLRVHTYDETESQFDNALISTSVIIFRNEPPKSEQSILISHGGSLSAPTRRRVERSAELAVQPRWSFSFLESKHTQGASAQHVGDFFDVKRGIATGANSLFLLNSQQLASFNVDPSWVKPLFPRARAIEGGVINSDEHGVPVPNPEFWLIDTADSIEKINARSPQFADYLTSIESTASKSALVRRRQPFYSQEKRQSPQLAFVYMAKSSLETRRRFIANHSQATVLNNYLALYPKPFLQERLDADAALLDAIHQSLGSISNQELIIQGRVYGSGLLKLEPKELMRLRVPSDPIWTR